MVFGEAVADRDRDRTLFPAIATRWPLAVPVRPAPWTTFIISLSHFDVAKWGFPGLPVPGPVMHPRTRGPLGSQSPSIYLSYSYTLTYTSTI